MRQLGEVPQGGPGVPLRLVDLLRPPVRVRVAEKPLGGQLESAEEAGHVSLAPHGRRQHLLRLHLPS